MAGVPAAEVAGKSIATLKNELAIDPILFNFELVCGQVVKVDPATGVKYPVPGATVNVYDLVCHWLWFFPPDWPWSWGFRLPECVSELIGSVVTDACGDFCILIPRWDVEWIRVWIQERWCLPELLRRPSVADLLLPHLPVSAAAPRTPPDPASLAGLLDARSDLAAAIGPSAVQAIRDAARGRVVGAPATGLSQVLASPAFARAVPAPVPAELRALSPAEAMRSLSSRLGLPPAKGELDLAASYGPFPRCFDIEVPIWVPFFSVPDITFQVTQQIGGTQQVIYDGAFDAGWAAHPLFQDVELDVAQFAVASPFPGCQPQGIGCENEPAIVQIGYLDVNPSYLDPATGFAVRMNRDSGGDVPSTAPFQGVLPLFGCAPDAQFYRVMASYADSSGLVFDSSGSVVPLPASAFGPALPVIAPAWQVSRIVGGVPELSPPIVPDADGWYSTDYLSWDPQNLLVNWSPIDGVYQLTAETGTGSPGSVTPTGSSSPAVVLVVDTSRPVIATFTPTSWNYVGGTPNPFTSDDGCFIIERTRADIEVNVAYNVTASHLHSVYLVPDGCDTAGVTVTNTGGLVVEPPLSNDLRHIYDGPTDNSIGGTVTYKISADAANGCYSWTLTAFSRAFTPNDSAGLTDVGGFAWNYTQTWIWSNALTSVGVITTG